MPTIIHHAVHSPRRLGKSIELKADRQALSKRRWHGVAEDGTEFGFDLEGHLHDGDVIFETDTAHYVLRQTPEPVLEVALGDSLAAAQVAWSLGNLHFPIELNAHAIRVTDDPAVRLFFEREKIAFTAVTHVFHPMRAIAHVHGSHHH